MLRKSKGFMVSNGILSFCDHIHIFRLSNHTLSLLIFAEFLPPVTSSPGEAGFFTTEVTPGLVAHRAGVQLNDRLLEINGENVEDASHDQVVEKIRLSASSLMLLLVDEETEEHYKNKRVKIGSWLATVKHLPHKPRIVSLTKGPDGYGFVLREEAKLTGKATC